jgi:nitrogen-specific signal transduction histidine kinase
VEPSGLGLSISYDIVTQQRGGSIEVESELGSSTEFIVRAPAASPAGGAAEGRAMSVSIMVVDHQPDVAEL